MRLRRFGWSGLLGVLVVAGSGCPGPKGQPLSLQGQMLSQAVLTPPPSLRLAIGWYPGWFGQTPGAPLKSVITQDATYSGTFPLDFTFTVDGPPPSDAIVTMVPPGGDAVIGTGQGKIAYGVLIAYEDRNGNGTLDLATETRPSPDRIAGISMPDPSRTPPPHSYFVVYLDGTVDRTDYFGSEPLAQGYNLLQLHSDYGIQPVPMDTSIAMELTNTDALGLYACQSAHWNLGMVTACGIDPLAGGYRLRGNVYGNRTSNQVWVEDGHGARADATLRLNGQDIPFDGPSQTFVLDTIPPGANTFEISVPGYAPETINLTMPNPVTLTSSTPASVASGSTLTFNWERDPAVELYDLYIVNNTTNAWVDHALTTDLQYVTRPLNDTGSTRATVYALGALAVGNNGSYLTPVNAARVNFDLTP